MSAQNLGIPVVADYRSADVRQVAKELPLCRCLTPMFFRQYGLLHQPRRHRQCDPACRRNLSGQGVGCGGLQLALEPAGRRLGVDFDARWKRRVARPSGRVGQGAVGPMAVFEANTAQVAGSRRPCRHCTASSMACPPQTRCALPWSGWQKSWGPRWSWRPRWTDLVTGGGAHNGFWCSASPTICRKGGAFTCRNVHWVRWQRSGRLCLAGMANSPWAPDFIGLGDGGQQ